MQDLDVPCLDFGMILATKESQMPTPKLAAPVRVLAPSEYPASITTSQGAYQPDVRFAAVHPLGLYYVEHQGAGHFQAYFVPKRKGSRAKNVGAGRGLAGAMARISAHEDELVNPEAPREMGTDGPVRIFSLGRRKAGSKTPTDLDREIESFLRTTKTSMSASDRVSAATFPTGIYYADRTVEVKGDYKRLAFLPFDTLELEWIAKRIPPDVRDYIERDAAKIQTHRGQNYQTSQAGQNVMLGSGSIVLKSPAQLDR